MKTFVCLVAIVILMCFDLPERLKVEQTQAIPATVTGYHYKATSRSPWYVEAKGRDGTAYRNDEGWLIRWLKVGETTEVKKGSRIYVGSYFMRTGYLIFLLPLLIIVFCWDRRSKHDES